MAQALIYDFSCLKLDLNKAYRICMSILHKPLIKSKITLANHLYANNTPIFLGELIDLGLIERVVLPAKGPAGRGCIIIKNGRRKQFGLNYYRLTSKGLEFLKEVAEQ